MKIAIVLFSVLFSLSVFARSGGSVGNGGDAVVCYNPDKSIKSVELLDFYEGRVEKGIVPNLNALFTVDQNIQVMLDRIGYHDHFAKDALKVFYATFNQEAKFIPGIVLVDIPDSEHISFPANCSVQQIAIQKEPASPRDARYTISKDLWDYLDNANKAGLIFHELLYRMRLEDPNASKNSLSVRYMNMLVAGDEVKNISLGDYIVYFSKELSIEKIFIGGLLANVRNVSLLLMNGIYSIQAYSGRPVTPMVFQTPSFQIPLDEKSWVTVRYKKDAAGSNITEFSFDDIAAEVIGQIDNYKVKFKRQQSFSMTYDQNNLFQEGNNFIIDTSHLSKNIGDLSCEKLVLQSKDHIKCYRRLVEAEIDAYPSTELSNFFAGISFKSKFDAVIHTEISIKNYLFESVIYRYRDYHESYESLVLASYYPSGNLSRLEIIAKSRESFFAVVRTADGGSITASRGVEVDFVEYYDNHAFYAKDIGFKNPKLIELMFIPHHSNHLYLKPHFVNGKPFEFYESGYIKTGFFKSVRASGSPEAPYYRTTLANGQKITIAEGDLLTFDENGEITAVN